jgi:hypothetical protein
MSDVSVWHKPASYRTLTNRPGPSPLRAILTRADRILCDRGLIVGQSILVQRWCVGGPAGALVLDRAFVDILIA